MNMLAIFCGTLRDILPIVAIIFGFQYLVIRKPVKPKRSPQLSVKLGSPKYQSWKSFIDEAYWSVGLK